MLKKLMILLITVSFCGNLIAAQEREERAAAANLAELVATRKAEDLAEIFSRLKAEMPSANIAELVGALKAARPSTTREEILTLLFSRIGLQSKEVAASAPIQSEDHKPFIIKSLDDQTFKIPYEVAMQSNLIRTTHEGDPEEIKISIPIHSSFLYPLVIAMHLIYHEANLLSPKQLYEKIQNNLFSKFNVEQTVKALHYSVELDFPILENVFADKIAQYLHQNIFQQVFDLLLQRVSSSNQIMRKTSLDSWYLIEKYYYLRSDQLKPKIDNLIIYNNIDLQNDLKINPVNAQFKFKQMIKKWNLSVNDLVDYSKKLRYENTASSLNTSHKNYILDLSNFFLTSLKGIKKITKTSDYAYYRTGGYAREDTPKEINDYEYTDFIRDFDTSVNQLRAILRRYIAGDLRYNNWFKMFTLNIENNFIENLFQEDLEGLNIKLINADNNPLNEESRRLVEFINARPIR